MKQINYKTKQKTAIMRCIKDFGDGHFTIDVLCEALSKNGETVGRTTVYRFLEKLSLDGVVQKFKLSSGDSTCYQYVGEENHCHEHFHLKCEKCGKLIHIDCTELNLLATHIKKHHNFLLDPLKTVIYGTCEECTEK